MISAPIRLPLRLPRPPSTTMASMVTSGASHMNGSTTNTGATTTPATAASAPEIATVALVLAHQLDDHAVADHRKRRHRPDRDQRRHHEAEPDLHHQRVEAVRGEHVKGGVRDVDDARDAENQRKADRQQRVHAAVDQPRY